MRGCLLDYEMSRAVSVCILWRPDEKRVVRHRLKSAQRENPEDILVNMQREGVVLVGKAHRGV
jgi:ribose 1,5-bisphosphokinase PhnN